MSIRFWFFTFESWCGKVYFAAPIQIEQPLYLEKIFSVFSELKTHITNLS